MLTAPERARFRKRLLAWFDEFQRDLPWRRTKDPYRIWLSEIMLQQTRVTAAIPYYERFLGRFPDVESLAEADDQEVLRHWAGLGYYSRARNLQKAARQIVAEHGSRFPKDPNKALALAGIGSYTAAAVLSIAYKKKMAVVDGNVARVLARLDATRGDLRKGSQWQQLQKRADELLAPSAPGDWNQAMMELGATICTPRSPQCLLCPVAEFCEARKQGLTDVIPDKRLQRHPVELILATLVLVDPAGQTLLLPPPKRDVKAMAKHDVATLLSRMWHFPTIHVKQDPVRELRAFAKGAIFSGQKITSKFRALAKVRHAVTYRQITVLSFRMDVAVLPLLPGSKKLTLNELSTVPISNLTRKIAESALSASEIAAREPRGRTASLSF